MFIRVADTLLGRRQRPLRMMALFICSFALLTGCEAQRQNVADLISPPSAAQIAERIDRAVEHDQAAAAIETGEAFLRKQADPEGQVHRALVGAYLAIGNAVQAAHHMELSVADGATAAPKTAPQPVPAEPATAATPSVAPTAPAAPAAPAAPDAPVAPAAGLSVKAGDASVTIPK